MNSEIEEKTMECDRCGKMTPTRKEYRTSGIVERMRELERKATDAYLNMVPWEEVVNTLSDKDRQEYDTLSEMYL